MSRTLKGTIVNNTTKGMFSKLLYTHEEVLNLHPGPCKNRLRHIPGLNESVAGVDNVVHLQVDGRVHDRHNEALLQRETGRVHELQEDCEAFWVNLRVQTDSIHVAF